MGETSIAEAGVAVDEEAQVEAFWQGYALEQRQQVLMRWAMRGDAPTVLELTALYLEDPDSIHVRDTLLRMERERGNEPLAHDPWAEAN